MRVFIDSNIPMYVAGREHPCRGPARRFLEKVRQGQVQGCSSTEVLQEILYRYSALHRTDLGADVYRLFVEICPVVFDVTVADTDLALEILLTTSNVSARDAVHAAVMVNRQVEWIATFDTGFDSLPGIRRYELGD